MNIILVPEGIRKSRIASFSHRQILAITVISILVLPVSIGTVTYHVAGLLGQGSQTAHIERIRHQQAQLAGQRQAIEEARRHTEAHLNALAQRMGRMQAQVMRLNALGGRLTHMAGIDTREFGFAAEPAIGGPAERGASVRLQDLFRPLDTLDNQIARQSEQLSALQTLIINHNTHDALTPSGWPVSGGWLSSAFGMRADPFSGRISLHRGVDIASPLGSDIFAMGDGVVTYAGKHHGYGNMVAINHGRGYSTRYAHASKVLVVAGERVSKGQVVAQVGNSGRSTGPHLHFEVLQQRRHIDPTDFLQQTHTRTVAKQRRIGIDGS